MKKRYFITGIGTDVGKTLASAILTEALEADYWKPVQAGDLQQSDTIKVISLISNIRSKFHQEAYQLSEPMSPHAAAKIDGVRIDVSSIQLPETENDLIIEGAGGLMVPLNDQQLILDLIKQLDVEVIVVSQNYLGSINHTLLTIGALMANKISVRGIIFNGDENKETESFILSHTGVDFLGRIKQHSSINKEVVLAYKSLFNSL